MERKFSIAKTIQLCVRVSKYPGNTIRIVAQIESKKIEPGMNERKKKQFFDFQFLNLFSSLSFFSHLSSVSYFLVLFLVQQTTTIGHKRNDRIIQYKTSFYQEKTITGKKIAIKSFSKLCSIAFNYQKSQSSKRKNNSTRKRSFAK